MSANAAHAARPAMESSVAWHESTRDADLALRAHVARVLGVAPDAIRSGRLCAECGASSHGQPWATGGVHVSLSRSGPHLITAVSTTGPIGVDVEAIEAIEAADDWARKEAILKLIGRGLAVPMSEIEVGEYDVRDLEAPAGYRAAAAQFRSETGRSEDG